MSRKLVLALLLVSTNSFAFFSDVEKSWEGANVYLPGSPATHSTQELANLPQAYPVVIYMHGCAGIFKPHDLRWGQALANRGFVVIQPDSMARSGRVSNCNVETRRATQAFKQWAYYREQEIDYALEQVQKSKWANVQNIFLIGHSEGGIATALYSGKGFRANVIMGWNCTQRQYPRYDGLASPKNVPIMTINKTMDPWFTPDTGMDGSCTDKASGRQVTPLLIEGYGHTFFSRENADMVAKFLKDNAQ